MLSLASCTLGWSNGLIPSTQPATAVANSAKKKIRPRSMRAVDRQRHRRLAGLRQRLDLRVERPRRARRRCAGRRTGGRRRRRPASPSGSSATGRMPLPSLPVLSATSCSTHRPKLAIGSETTKRELVAALQRPGSPISSPSHRPELLGRRVVARCSSARRPARGAAAPRRRRPSARPARARSTRAPSSARRCRGRSRTRAGSRARSASVDQRAARVGDGDEVAARLRVADRVCTARGST